MRPVRHRRTRPIHRSARRGLSAVAVGTAAVLVAGLAGMPGALADPRPSTTSSQAVLFDDMGEEADLKPLIEAVGRNVEAVGDTIAGIGTSVDAIQTDLADFVTTLPTLLGSVGDDPGAGLEVVQAALTAEAGELVAAGLPEVLALVSRIAAPSCFTLGAAAAALPEATEVLPLDELIGELAPVVEIDRAASDALLQAYTQAFALLLAPPALPPGAEAIQPYLTIASLLLSLLAVDVETTHYSAGADPLVRNTPALLGLPVLLDVDGRLGYDMCAITNADLVTGGITQSISRLPLRKKALEVDVKANFLLGFLNAGYKTQGSQAPTIYETALSLTGPAIDTSVVAPGPSLVQTLGLTSAINITWASVGTPANYTFASSKAGGATGNGTQYNYTGSASAESFKYQIALAGLSLGITTTPAPTALSYCTSARGFCSDQPGVDKAIQTASMHLHASEVVRLTEQPPIPALCLLFGVIRVACGSADVTAKDLDFGVKVPSNGNPSATPPVPPSPEGNVWVDTNGLPASGNIQTGGIVATLPVATDTVPAFKAEDRQTTWSGVPASIFSPAQPALTKNGTITCPAGTAANAGTNLGFGLSRYFCSFPPVNTSPPTISISAPTSTGIQVGKTLTRGNGTWTPGAPNTPSFAYQWQRCLAEGTTCVNIMGATNITYVVAAADMGSRMRLVVFGSNLDGMNVQAMSVATALVPGTPPGITGLSAEPAAEADPAAQKAAESTPETEAAPPETAVAEPGAEVLAEAEAAQAQAEAAKDKAQSATGGKVEVPPAP